MGHHISIKNLKTTHTHNNNNVMLKYVTLALFSILNVYVQNRITFTDVVCVYVGGCFHFTWMDGHRKKDKKS